MGGGLRVRQPQGVGSRLKSSLTYMSLLLIHSNRFVQVGLPEMPALGLVIPPVLAW